MLSVIDEHSANFKTILNWNEIVMSRQDYEFDFDGGLSVWSLDDLEWVFENYNTEYISVSRCYEHTDS